MAMSRHLPDRELLRPPIRGLASSAPVAIAPMSSPTSDASRQCSWATVGINLFHRRNQREEGKHADRHESQQSVPQPRPYPDSQALVRPCAAGASGVATRWVPHGTGATNA